MVGYTPPTEMGESRLFRSSCPCKSNHPWYYSKGYGSYGKRITCEIWKWKPHCLLIIICGGEDILTIKKRSGMGTIIQSYWWRSTTRRKTQQPKQRENQKKKKNKGSDLIQVHDRLITWDVVEQKKRMTDYSKREQTEVGDRCCCCCCLWLMMIPKEEELLWLNMKWN